MKLPDGYRGAVVEKRAPPPPPAAQPEHDATDLQQEEAEEHVPLGSLEAKAEFEELVVWGHEAMADAASDPYIRIEEWTQIAEQVPPISLQGLTPGFTWLTLCRYILIQLLRRAHELFGYVSCTEHGVWEHHKALEYKPRSGV